MPTFRQNFPFIFRKQLPIIPLLKWIVKKSTSPLIEIWIPSQHMIRDCTPCFPLAKKHVPNSSILLPPASSFDKCNQGMWANGDTRQS